MQKYYVYEIVNTMATIEYVGMTKNIKKRINDHFRRKPDAYGNGKFFKRADCILYRVGEFETKRQALDYERELTKYWGLKHQGEKLSEALKGENHPFFGKARSEDFKRKQSESMKGRTSPMKGKTHSKESKRKQSESMKVQWAKRKLSQG